MYFSTTVATAILSLSSIVSAYHEDCSGTINSQDASRGFSKQRNCGRNSRVNGEHSNYLHSNIDHRNVQTRYLKPRAQQAPQGWREDMNACKRVGTNDQDERRRQCFIRVCTPLVPDERDRCWDSINAMCYRRSSVDRRDACHSGRGECKDIENKTRRDDCYRRHPAAPRGAPAPVPNANAAQASAGLANLGSLLGGLMTRPTPSPAAFPPPPPSFPPSLPSSSPPQSSAGLGNLASLLGGLFNRPTPTPSSGPLPPQSPSPPAPKASPPPPRDNTPPPPAFPPPLPPLPSDNPEPSENCAGDQDCYDKGKCSWIDDNLKHDECLYKKRNKQCDSMRTLLSRDFCYACTGRCGYISGSSPESKEYKQGCERGETSTTC